ncbi:hypothetical protein [Phytohabitans flavus]|uniref:hypothetical protein n=1 Tax=Phytohabitans flavus TaxID=1076124 RepID=UPI0015649F18|nr:hypothetical protein [Phytohabitans flavus]
MPAAQVDLPSIEVICAALLRLSAAQPLVISIDDIEHADAESRWALLFMARRTHFARIVLVLSHTDPSGYAEGGTAAELARQSHCHTVHLEPLSKQGVRTLAWDLVGHEAGQRLHLPWFRLSGGNPLLVAALAEDYRERLRAIEDDRSVAVHVAGARYGRAVLACLHRGGERVVQVARGLAVLGARTVSTTCSASRAINWPAACMRSRPQDSPLAESSVPRPRAAPCLAI